jgi:uncharacterized protein YqhQ
MTNQPHSPDISNLYYGGQAVMEGVMIRGPHHMAVAVRHPGGHIVKHAERLSGIYTGPLRRVPLIRGMVVLWETMALGMRALSYSSRIAFEGPGANLLERLDAHRAVVVAVEGAIRLGLFVGYIWLIGRVAEIRRVFQYHGAEHMTIHAYEAGRPLTVEAVRPFPKEHTRCGTSFLLIVVAVALVTFFVFDLLVDEGILVRTGSRIVFIPPIAGLSYEVLRIGARFGGNFFVHAMFIPNIALQALTTRVPDDSQIEVAIASFEAVLAVTRAEPGQAGSPGEALEATPPLD